MLAEWITAQPQSEYRWRIETNMGPAGAHVTDIERALVRLCMMTAPAATCRQLRPASWRSGLARAGRLDGDVVDLLYTDSHQSDGTNAYHWQILLDLSRGQSGRDRQRVALLADPLADALRCEAWESLLRSRVHRVYRIRRTPGYPEL